MADYMIVERSQLVDIIIDSNFSGNSIPVPDQPMLRDKRILGIEFYTVNDMPISPITGNPLPSGGVISLTSFTGYTGDPQDEKDTGEYVYRIPLISLHNSQNGVDTFVQRVLRFDDLNLQWEKSQLVFSAIYTPGTTTSFVCNVIYTSRKQRHIKMLGKAIHGLTDGTLVELLMSKLMMLENKLKELMSGGNR